MIRTKEKTVLTLIRQLLALDINICFKVQNPRHSSSGEIFDTKLCVYCVEVRNGNRKDQNTYEPRCKKTGIRGFRPGPTQTGLYSHRRWLEA